MGVYVGNQTASRRYMRASKYVSGLVMNGGEKSSEQDSRDMPVATRIIVVNMPPHDVMMLQHVRYGDRNHMRRTARL